MHGPIEYFAYAAPLALIWFMYLALRRISGKRAEAIQAEARDAGLTEPASLHPSIDPVSCLGCGSCVSACPEGKILGLINGKAEMIEPTHCIGHGACADACPTGAISLVFGSETRGVDIPFVGPDFQTNVPGVFIAGELGGMGLIRNAVEQGRQAIGSIAATLTKRDGASLDVVIVGAGPAGLAATLAAKDAKLNYVTLEQETIGGAIAHYPRGKLVMTKPAILPLVGKMSLRDPSKEALLEFWNETVRKTGVAIEENARVAEVRQIPGGFEVITPHKSYRTRSVLLTIGRRGTPRKLGVPGEDLSKVVYRMIDPGQYTGRHVLVVGGGDSALEAAAEIAEQPNSKVILAYRGDAFSRARQRNRERVANTDKSKLHVALNSDVAEIHNEAVILSMKGARKRAANDDVIICAGGVLPNDFLKNIGVAIETKYGSR